MKNTLKYTFLSALFLGVGACDVDNTLPEITDPVNTIQLESGTADFSKYISVGASFTAGFTDGALFKAGQEYSFPNTLAKKFAMVGGAEFNQPLMNDNIGGMVSGGATALDPRFYFNALTGKPTRLTSTPTTVVGVPATNAPNFMNYGIPGAKSFHFVAPGYGSAAGLATVPATANPYFVRMSPAQSTLIAEVASKQPTFFTLSEVGGNDVLDYAVAGGASGSVTPTVLFDQAFGAIINTLAPTADKKGVVANIPYITSLPHFTTVPYKPLDPTNPSFGPQIPTLNNVFGAINGVFTAIGVPERSIVFSTTAASAVVIKDESLDNKTPQIIGALLASPTFPAFVAGFGLPTDPLTLQKVAGLLGSYYGQARQATAEDLLVLPSSGVIGTVNQNSVNFLLGQGLPPTLAGMFSAEGVSLPLENKWVLTKTEVAEIKTATDAYNTTIKAAADAKGLAFVDFKAILEQASTTGLVFDEFNMSTSLVTGGLVSLDGIHLTSRGYALMANKMLEAIDATYGSNFTKGKDGLAKAKDYPTNFSPTLQ